LDFAKIKKVMVGIDSDYNYHEKGAKHYDKLLERKHEASEKIFNKYGSYCRYRFTKE